MTKKILQEGKKMAIEAGFDDVVYKGKWYRFEILDPIFNDDEEHCIGYPQYILWDGKNLRWTLNGEEGLNILRDLAQD
ncbi:MAG: hypothetical protein ACI3ZZ_01795 [Candidatus Aphodosoma sp.]